MGKNEIHGWLVMDKPSGISSNNFMFQVKKILRPKKIGHAGTLDPFATGILLIAFGEATKTVGYGMQRGVKIEILWILMGK
jgi:tRNA pseudouridine55 synthase